ncbi:hypothetical protein NHQ30_009513 [Ciborinia camelliae]|nr:hypothetical protein NHQ30_009513 [Ciborinia camelliae]
MSLSLYDVSVPPFIKQLKSLQKILAIGQEHVKNDESKLIHAKLIDDMGDLIFQIQRVSDTAKGLAVRVGGAENVVLEDNETDMAHQVMDVSLAVKDSIGRSRSGGFNFNGYEKLQERSARFAGLYSRITRTIEILEALPSTCTDGKDSIEIVMKIGSGDLKFTAKDYVVNYAIPNFFFHVVTAYDILRKEGVPVGKKNYLGRT